MKITKTVNVSNAVIAVDGWLDTQTSPQLGAAAQELSPDIESVELDFSKLEYISSAGLRQIVAIYKSVNSLTITNVSAEIMDVFRMTGFDKRLDIR